MHQKWNTRIRDV